MTVETTGRIVEVPVGEAILGRVNKCYWFAFDKGPIMTKQFRPVEMKLPGVVDRQRVKDLANWYISAIDTYIIPIGKT